FFVVLGARIDLRALAHSRDDVVFLVVLSVAMAAVPILTAKIMRLPLSSGLLATAAMGVPAAIVAIGLPAGQLRPGQAAAIVGAAAVSLAVAAVGAYRIGERASITQHARDDEE